MQQVPTDDHSADMKPDDHYTNGDEDSGSGSEAEADAEAAELSLDDPEAPARALGALNALRKARQHYDVLLQADGASVPAHRAVLGAASPLLLEALGASPAAPHRLDVDGAALRALVDYAYTGRLPVADRGAARRLCAAAWRLRLEPARAQLAERLLRRPRAADCLALRALPGLRAPQLRQLDRFIAERFDDVCASGALNALPQVRLELLRAPGADPPPEPLALAEAVLAWLRDRPAAAADRDFDELCSHTHLVYVDARGALRDCDELPAAAGDAPELTLYRREAAQRRAGAAPSAAAPRPDAECGVLAARRAPLGGARALLVLRGALLGARAGWAAATGAPAGGPLAGAARAGRLGAGRAALGVAALGPRLLACGGYDRARVLRSVESYEPAREAWAPAADMRRERARFPVAVLGDTLYAIGGSDGHAELDSVDALRAGRWSPVARLPVPLSHAAAAADAAQGALYVAGGWAGGAHGRRVWRYEPGADAWREAAPLRSGRAQCAGAVWRGALWVLGGCDAWHCLAGTERLPLPRGADWEAGPPLPSARRSMGASVWRGRLVVAGGSDGAASLRRTDWLEEGRGAEDWAAEGWAGGPALRRARAAPGLAVLGEVLYAVGGFDGKEFLDCAEYLSRPDGEWTALSAPSRPSAPPAPPAPPAPRPREDEETSEKRDSEEKMTGGEPAAAADSQ